MVSEDPPVFVVADGVTLDIPKMINDGFDYPRPSPAGAVARIFCESVAYLAKEKYQGFDKKDIDGLFSDANRRVRVHNEKMGENVYCGNPTGFYAATGAFVVIRGQQAYWASICDSYVSHFDKHMRLKSMSSGSCRPYAVINGEERMVNHLEKGTWKLEPGDLIFVYTDGYAYYMEDQAFLEIFADWDKDPEQSIDAYSMEANAKDLYKYGRERSLIVVRF